MRGSSCPIPAICRRRRGSRTGWDFPNSIRANGCAFYCRCVHAHQYRSPSHERSYIESDIWMPLLLDRGQPGSRPPGYSKVPLQHSRSHFKCRRCAVVRVAIRRATELNFTPDAPYRCYDPSESRRSGEYAGVLLGNLTVMTVPSSSCKASSLMVALCWSAISLTIARPRPLPLDSLPGIR